MYTKTSSFVDHLSLENDLNNIEKQCWGNRLKLNVKSRDIPENCVVKNMYIKLITKHFSLLERLKTQVYYLTSNLILLITLIRYSCQCVFDDVSN